MTSVGTPVSSNTCSTPVSKSMITNASFRTKKLPGNKINKYFPKIVFNKKLSGRLFNLWKCLILLCKKKNVVNCLVGLKKLLCF